MYGNGASLSNGHSMLCGESRAAATEPFYVRLLAPVQRG